MCVGEEKRRRKEEKKRRGEREAKEREESFGFWLNVRKRVCDRVCVCKERKEHEEKIKEKKKR